MKLFWLELSSSANHFEQSEAISNKEAALLEMASLWRNWFEKASLYSKRVQKGFTILEKPSFSSKAPFCSKLLHKASPPSKRLHSARKCFSLLKQASLCWKRLGKGFTSTLLELPQSDGKGLTLLEKALLCSKRLYSARKCFAACSKLLLPPRNCFFDFTQVEKASLCLKSFFLLEKSSLSSKSFTQLANASQFEKALFN